MNKATIQLNERAIIAAQRRSLGASFENIAEVFGVSKDRARTLVARGEKLTRFAVGDKVVRKTLHPNPPVGVVRRVYSNRILVKIDRVTFTILKWHLRKAK